MLLDLDGPIPGAPGLPGTVLEPLGAHPTKARKVKTRAKNNNIIPRVRAIACLKQLMFLRKLVARTIPRSRTKNKKHIPLNAASMTTATSPFNIANPSRGPGETWLQSFVSGFIQDLFLSTFGHPGTFFAGSRIMRERKHQTVFVHRLICRLCWLSRPPSFRYVRGAESVLHLSPPPSSNSAPPKESPLHKTTFREGSEVTETQRVLADLAAIAPPFNKSG